MTRLQQLEKQFDGGSLADRSKMLKYGELMELVTLLQKELRRSDSLPRVKVSRSVIKKALNGLR